MNSSRMSFLAMAMLAFLLIVSPASEAAISCSEVVKDLKPCVNYLANGSGNPPSACCAGISALASAASTSADKKAACQCIKAQASKLSIKKQLAEALPGNCGISLPVAVSPNVDCSKVG